MSLHSSAYGINLWMFPLRVNLCSLCLEGADDGNQLNRMGRSSESPFSAKNMASSGDVDAYQYAGIASNSPSLEQLQSPLVWGQSDKAKAVEKVLSSGGQQ